MTTTASTDLISFWRRIFNGLEHTICVTGLDRRPVDERIDPMKVMHESYFKWPAQAADAERRLHAMADAGLDVYFCAHLLVTNKRTGANAAKLHAAYVDRDTVPTLPAGAPRPTITIQSSPGHYQDYYLFTRAVEPGVGEEINHRLAYALGADMSGWDLSQLLRPPTFPNRKYPDDPIVSIVDDAGPVYDPDELLASLPPVPAKATPTRPIAPPGITTAADSEILTRLRAMRGGQWGRLFDTGDLSDYRSNWSSADQALANGLIAACDGDATRADAIFRQSGLMRPKWDEVHYASGETYGEHTLDTALAWYQTLPTSAPSIRHRTIVPAWPATDDTCTETVVNGVSVDPTMPMADTSCQSWIAEVERLNAEMAMERSARLTAENERDEARARLTRIYAIAAHPDIPNASTKLVMIVATKDLAAPPRHQGEREGNYRVPNRDRLREQTGGRKVGKNEKGKDRWEGGVSQAIASRAIKECATLAGWAVETEENEKTGYSEIRVITPNVGDFNAIADDLIRARLPETAPRRPRPGGDHRHACEDHPDASLIKQTAFICSVCGTIVCDDHQERVISDPPETPETPASIMAAGSDVLAGSDDEEHAGDTVGAGFQNGTPSTPTPKGVQNGSRPPLGVDHQPLTLLQAKVLSLAGQYGYRAVTITRDTHVGPGVDDWIGWVTTEATDGRLQQAAGILAARAATVGAAS